MSHEKISIRKRLLLLNTATADTDKESLHHIDDSGATDRSSELMCWLNNRAPLVLWVVHTLCTPCLYQSDAHESDNAPPPARHLQHLQRQSLAYLPTAHAAPASLSRPPTSFSPTGHSTCSPSRRLGFEHVHRHLSLSHHRHPPLLARRHLRHPHIPTQSSGILNE